jgi:type I restriction enzyme S subunit
VQITSGESPSLFRFGPGGTPYFKVQQLSLSRKYLRRQDTPYLAVNAPEVARGSVMFAKRGAAIRLNNIRILAEPGYMDTNVMALTPVGEFTGEYLFYALTFVGLWSVADITSIPQINNKHIKPLCLPLPSKEEQRAITNALTDVDDFIATLERLIAKKETIKQGIMQQLLTGATRLPGFVGSWRDVVLGDVVSYVKTIPLSRAQLDEGSPLSYLHYGDIHTARTVVLDAAHMAMPRVAVALARTAEHLQVGDLVLVDASEDAAGVGKSLEITSVPRDGIVPGLHTIAARFDKAVIADSFKAYLQFIPTFRAALLRLAAGTKVLAITRSHISSMSLSLPNVDEQRAIALALRDCDTELDALHACLAKARSIKQGMMQELLTGRTRLTATEEKE